MTSSAWCPTNAPETNRALDTLSHHLRREIIHYFENVCEGNTSELDEVVAHIHPRLQDVGRQELALALHHTHLQKLDSRGWIDYDPRSGFVRYHGHESVEELLTGILEMFLE